MALLTLKAPVDYSAQQGKEQLALLNLAWLTQLPAAFEDFLTGYKSTTPVIEDPSIALQDLRLEQDGDNTSDEYDFMEDVAAAKEKHPSRTQTAGANRKYMDQLQQVVDRKRTELLIELDDLENVPSFTHNAAVSC